ncbi:MAG: alpha/beta hydrolase [Bacteroidota bacterium]
MTKAIKLSILLSLLFCAKAYAQTTDTLVDVGGHQLHFRIIEGSGTPILFESGNGDDASVWEPILQRIHEGTGATLITYDRAGLGGSGIDTSKISFAREAKQLKRALRKLGYHQDFFLVAHSFGSFYASEFSRRVKGKIVGAVFIDVATPCALTVAYASKVKRTISTENWTLIKSYKIGLYYVLQEFPQIAAYMSDRFISNATPLTLIAAEIREPVAAIGDTEQDVINATNCLEAFGQLPNHKYVLAPNTEHKVWERSPEIVINEIVELYNLVAGESSQ